MVYINCSVRYVQAKIFKCVKLIYGYVNDMKNPRVSLSITTIEYIMYSIICMQCIHLLYNYIITYRWMLCWDSLSNNNGYKLKKNKQTSANVRIQENIYTCIQLVIM